jgi:hypothetical protein
VTVDLGTRTVTRASLGSDGRRHNSAGGLEGLTTSAHPPHGDAHRSRRPARARRRSRWPLPRSSLGTPRRRRRPAGFFETRSVSPQSRRRGASGPPARPRAPGSSPDGCADGAPCAVEQRNPAVASSRRRCANTCAPGRSAFEDLPRKLMGTNGAVTARHRRASGRLSPVFGPVRQSHSGASSTAYHLGPGSVYFRRVEHRLDVHRRISQGAPRSSGAARGDRRAEASSTPSADRRQGRKARSPARLVREVRPRKDATER